MKEPSNYLELEAACVLWEAVDGITLDSPSCHIAEADKPARDAIRNAREAYGTGAMRRACIMLAQHLSDTWHALPEDRRDVLAFDWDFAPAYALCVADWSGMAERGEMPKVPSIAEAANLLLPLIEAEESQIENARK